MILKLIHYVEDAVDSESYYECDKVVRSVHDDGSIELIVETQGKPFREIRVDPVNSNMNAFLLSERGKTIETIGRWRHPPT